MWKYMLKLKVKEVDELFQNLYIQCVKIEKMYERKVNEYISTEFKKFDTSIDFYEKIIDNMNN